MEVGLRERKEYRAPWYRKPFNCRELNDENGAALYAVYEKVADHLVKYWEGPHRVYFGFPGARWQFEHLLLSKCADRRWFRCIGLFDSVQKMEFSRGWMPGPKTDIQAKEHGYNFRLSQNFGTKYTLDAIESACAVGLHLHLDTYLNICDRDIESNCPYKLNEWLGKFAAWSCFWLDCSTSFSGLFPLLQKLQYHCMNPKVPFAISFQLGRDCKKFMEIVDADRPLESRSELLRAALMKSGPRAVQITEYMEYDSASAHPAKMGLVLGVLS